MSESNKSVFPIPSWTEKGIDDYGPFNVTHPAKPGLTLREYFAAMAMQGELASQMMSEYATHTYSEKSASDLARVSVVFADALIAELKKEKS